MSEPVVDTASGAVRGTTIATAQGAVHRFTGIPFGRAPVEGARFRIAEPSPGWSGERPAQQFGPSPMQAVDGPYGGLVPGMAAGRVDEDCLSLNVWCPAAPASAPRPVMMWVYGGAFVTGGSAMATYEASRLSAEQDVIVVSANHRVGALGFLDLRGVPGGDSTDTNCGLHDLLLALRWVHDHIDQFGGDPTQVTVFGESAGAGAILHLLSTTAIGSLARRAIVQSPGIDFTQSPSVAADVAAAFVACAGVSTVDELRALPAARIVDVQQQVAGALMFDVGTMVFHPVVDGALLAATPSVAIGAGAADGIDLLIGYTADEMRLFPDPRADEIGTDGLVAWTRAYLATRAGRDVGATTAARLVESYLAALGTHGPVGGADTWAAIQTDGVIRQPVVRLAAARAPSAATFVYQFQWSARRPRDALGAFHAIELPFVFDAFDVDGWDAFVAVDDGGRALGRDVRAAWAAFARTGDPTTASLGAWPRHEPSRRATMILDERCHVATDPLARERSWWSGLWDPSCRPAAVPR